ncbi:MAG: outer membrane beta-barrel protein [Sphingobium sp.]
MLTSSLPGEGHAQSVSTQVFETIVPFTYNRGRNESVTDRPRPEYDPVGVNLGGFTLFPSLTLAGGFTDNVYQSSAKTSSAIATVAPAAILRSNWAVHGLQLNARGDFVRYLAEPVRNEDGWSVGAQGRLDLGADKTLTGQARTARLYEAPFSGTGVPVSARSLPVQATSFRGAADLRFARTRAVLSVDHTIFNNLPGRNFNGDIVTRDTFDRNVTRGTGHIEYGVTPETGVFLEAIYGGTDYRFPLSPSVANRDSEDVKVLAGVSFDISALIRGSFGVGYVKRDYKSPLYQDIKGLSASGKIEYFPSELTTVTLVFRRDVEDSTFAGSSGYFSNGVSGRIDHEFLRNLLGNIGVDYEHDSYRGVSAEADILRVAGGARYLVSPMISIDSNLSYRKRSSTAQNLVGNNIDELRGTIGLAIRR